MLAGSPTAFLLWAILACLFFLFLLIHLWLYDRFRCLSWNTERQPGTFRRIMTYCYVCTVPLLVLYSVSMTVVKYKEGYIIYDGTVFPKPPEFWHPSHKGWVVPLNFVVSFIWVLEFTIHLEELTFWLFLLHQGPSHRDWFTSWEFRTWQIGSYIALLALPTIALVTRKNLSTGDAWLFLAGASGALVTTFCFVHVLIRFPNFVRTVKAGGATADVVHRLRGFYRLNLVRVGFRFLFTVPLLALSIDALAAPIHDKMDALARMGISLYSPRWLDASAAGEGSVGWRRSHPVVGDPFITDFMLILGGIGCVVSSGITLLIFFPIENASPPPSDPPQLARAHSSATVVHPTGAVPHTAPPGTGPFYKTHALPPGSVDGHALADVSVCGSPYYARSPYEPEAPWSPLEPISSPTGGGGAPAAALAAPPLTRPTRAASLSAHSRRPSASMASSSAGSSSSHAPHSPTLYRAPSLASAVGPVPYERTSTHASAPSPTLYAASVAPPAPRWVDEGAVHAGEYFRRPAVGVEPDPGGVHPYVTSFRSPIDLYDDGEPRAV